MKTKVTSTSSGNCSQINNLYGRFRRFFTQERRWTYDGSFELYNLRTEFIVPRHETWAIEAATDSPGNLGQNIRRLHQWATTLGHMGSTSCMLITDRLTKGVILIDMRDTTAEDVTEVYLAHLYMRHEVPLAIVSDRGPQFVSSFWERICERLAI